MPITRRPTGSGEFISQVASGTRGSECEGRVNLRLLCACRACSGPLRSLHDRCRADRARTGSAGLRTASVVVQRCCAVARRLSAQGVACSSGSPVACPLRARSRSCQFGPLVLPGVLVGQSVSRPLHRRDDLAGGYAMLGFVNRYWPVRVDPGARGARPPPRGWLRVQPRRQALDP